MKTGVNVIPMEETPTPYILLSCNLY